MEEHSDINHLYFEGWPQGADPAEIGLQLARLFDSRETREDKHYKEACVWYGALSIARILGEQPLIETLIRKYEPFRNSYAELLSGEGHVDMNVFGIVPLEISKNSGDPFYLDEGIALADHQKRWIDKQIRFAIDDMFMITSLQVQAFRASGDPSYLDLAADVMARYLEKLQQEDGLFYHHGDFHHKWGRGNGWVAAGMAELIRELPANHGMYAAIHEGYQKMMEGLLKYQIREGSGKGLWKQIVDSDDPRNWPESSGSAMFCYALAAGVKQGWLDGPVFGPAARSAWFGLTGDITEEGEITNTSNWAYKPMSHPEAGDRYDNDEENYYFERDKLTGDNHGQAPVLWAAAELLC